MTVPEKWYKHQPQVRIDIGDTNIMYDKKLITDKRARHNKPDIIIHDKSNQSCQIIDVAIPVDANVNKKIAEKLTKYKDLQIQLTKIHEL